MSSLPVFAGLDCHQSSVQVCVVDQDGKVLTNRSVDNREDRIYQVLTRNGVPAKGLGSKPAVDLPIYRKS